MNNKENEKGLTVVEKKEESKKKFNIKKTVLLSLIILVVIVGGVSIYWVFFYKNKLTQNNNNSENSKELRIVSKISLYDYDEYKDVFNNYIFVSKDGKLGAVDKNNKVVIDFKYSENSFISYENNSDDAFVIHDNEKYDLYDKDLHLLASSNNISIIKDKLTGETFYLNEGKLYNLKNEEIISTSNALEIVKCGDYLFKYYDDLYKNQDVSYILNIKTGEKVDISPLHHSDGCESGESCFAYNYETKDFYYYDFNKNEFTSYVIVNEKTDSGDLGNYILKDKSGKKYFFAKSKGIIYDLNDGERIKDYTFKFDTCESGFKVYYKDGKLMSDTCFEDFYESNSDTIVLAYFGDESRDDDSYYHLYDDKIRELPDDPFLYDFYYSVIVGKYIKSFKFTNMSTNVETSDFDGNKVENNLCPDFNYLYNDTYYCYYYGSEENESFLFNENFEKISTNYRVLDFIKNSKYVIFAVDDKYGLLWNNEEIIPAIYDEITYSSNSNVIYAKDLWHCDIYYLEETDENNALSNDNLPQKMYEPYKDVDTEKMIVNYKLTDMSKLIYANEDLFKEYAYIVDNSNKMADYKEEVMKTFKILASNKNFFGKYELFKKLKKFEIGDVNKDNIYFYLSYFMYNENLTGQVYKCGDEYLAEGSDTMECDYLVLPTNPHFIVYGGTTYFSASYLNDNAILFNYPLQTDIIGALSYIFGYDNINDIFYNPKYRAFNLFKLFSDAGVSLEEYENFNSLTNIGYSPKEEDYYKITDTLITLYESKNNNKWYEDKEFFELICQMIGPYEVKPEYTKRYEEYKNTSYSLYLERIDEMFGPEIRSEGWSTSYQYLYNNDGTYLTFTKNNQDGTLSKVLVLKYDFKNSKVLDKKIIEY